MILTKEQQEVLLHDAARISGMDGHVQTAGATAAERVMQMFGGGKKTPRKTSYLYCDSVDACFYFQNDKAFCTFTARWMAGANDLSKLNDAGALISKMLDNMHGLADGVMKAAREAMEVRE